MPPTNHESPLLSRPDVAEVLEVSRQRVNALEERPGFPRPYAYVDGGTRPIWRRSAIVKFKTRREAKAAA